MTIRVKIKQGDIGSSQLIEIEELAEYLKKNTIEGYLRDGISVSFSVAKKSSIQKISK